MLKFNTLSNYVGQDILSEGIEPIIMTLGIVIGSTVTTEERRDTLGPRAESYHTIIG